jgi:hypothetical protein
MSELYILSQFASDMNVGCENYTLSVFKRIYRLRGDFVLIMEARTDWEVEGQT